MMRRERGFPSYFHGPKTRHSPPSQTQGKRKRVARTARSSHVSLFSPFRLGKEDEQGKRSGGKLGRA